MARWMEGREEEERGGGKEEEAPTTAGRTTWNLCNVSGVITKPSRMLRLVLSLSHFTQPHRSGPRRHSAFFSFFSIFQLYYGALAACEAFHKTTHGC